MTTKTAIQGEGFDVNQQLSAMQAEAFVKAGMLFVLRYFPRTPALVKGNLTALELEILLTAGLGVSTVQHVANPGWNPTGALGTQYGQYAGAYGKAVGYPTGGMIWLDLEEVAAGTTVQEVIDYCTAWFNEVTAAGYVSGLYVGWNVVLSDQELYDLPFKHYWRAYNCDQSIPTRGYQLLQHPQKTLDGITYDPNTCQADKLGDLPVWVSS